MENEKRIMDLLEGIVQRLDTLISNLCSNTLPDKNEENKKLKQIIKDIVKINREQKIVIPKDDTYKLTKIGESESDHYDTYYREYIPKGYWDNIIEEEDDKDE